MVTINPHFNQKLVDVNVGGTQNIIDKCLEHPECLKMVYVSSTGAIPEQPKGTKITETDHFTPIDEKRQVGCYSQTKAIATQAVLDACRDRGLNACVVHPSGITGPKDYAIVLEASYRNLALLQDWNAIQELFQDHNFESCREKLNAHGLTTTRENSNLICEVIRAGSDEALLRRALSADTVEENARILYENGYRTITADFLLSVRTNAAHLHDDDLLTQEDMQMLSGLSFMESCHKSINTLFAMRCIAELALGDGGVVEPAYLIAIAGGISLVYESPINTESRLQVI